MKVLTTAGLIVLCIGALLCLDRFFLKHNDSFSTRFIYSTLSYNPDWDAAPLLAEEKKLVDQALDQPFFYLGKGGQSFAFISADGNYVLKFCRFPSSLRPLSWLSHFFSRFTLMRILKTKKGIDKLHRTLDSFKLAYEELKEESGLLYLQINTSKNVKKTVLLVDKMGAHHQIPLDTVTFLLQKKATPVYNALDACQKSGDLRGAKNAIVGLIYLIAATAKKGIADHDPVLRKNYGFLTTRAIYIDVGQLRQSPRLKHAEAFKTYLMGRTRSLRKRLETFYPDFLPYYEEEIAHQLSAFNGIDS